MRKIIEKLSRSFSRKAESEFARLSYELDIETEGKVPDFVVKAKKYLLNLRTSHGAAYSLGDDELLVSIKGIDFAITTQEEAYILNEVFILGSYAFNSSRSCVVLDVGMNVGISSLFFAKMEYVKKVIGYEPFTPTYKRALQNIKLNATLEEKIESINLGLSNRNETKVVNYYENLKGSVSVTDDPQFVSNSSQKVSHEEVTLIKAEEVIKAIKGKYPDSDLVCKMDCEGSEYDIFSSLANLNKSILPEVFMVEWHYKGSQPIVNFLLERGYAVFDFPLSSNDIGMVYASKLPTR